MMGGKIDQIKGRIKEAVGVLTDDDRLKNEGKLDQVGGEVKETAERVAEKVKEKHQMTKYRRFRQGIIGVVGGALLVALVGCSTPLTTREKGTLIGGGVGVGTGALLGGGTGAVIGGALGAGGGLLVGDQLQKQDHESEGQERQLTAQARAIECQHREIESLKNRPEEQKEMAAIASLADRPGDVAAAVRAEFEAAGMVARDLTNPQADTEHDRLRMVSITAQRQILAALRREVGSPTMPSTVSGRSSTGPS